MIVYVLNYDGTPLMPTKRLGHVRWLLKTGQAVVVKKEPFTIKLTTEKKRYTQDITLVPFGEKYKTKRDCCKFHTICYGQLSLK